MGITLVHADARHYLSTLEDESFDVMVTDPPYGLPMWADGSFDWHLNDQDMDATTQLVTWTVEQAARLLKPAGYLYMTAGHEVFAAAVAAAARVGFKTRPWVWTKPNPTPAFPGAPWQSGLELCLFGYRKRPPSILYGGGKPNYLMAPPVVGNARIHPTQKPLELFHRWLEQTPGRVIDPFAGSGTTLAAAQMLGLDAVGVEKDPDFAARAAERLGLGLSLP